jgi:hypothetical protein
MDPQYDFLNFCSENFTSMNVNQEPVKQQTKNANVGSLMCTKFGQGCFKERNIDFELCRSFAIKIN